MGGKHDKRARYRKHTDVSVRGLVAAAECKTAASQRIT